MTAPEPKHAETKSLDPREVEVKTGSSYPAPFRAKVEGRRKQALGNALGLRNFGVNVVTLGPGDWSAQRHWHTRQDEFVYVLAGELTLVTESGESNLGPGTVAGFPAGNGDGHHLINRGAGDAVYLEVGDRMPGDEVVYPDIDLLLLDEAGRKTFTNKKREPL